MLILSLFPGIGLLDRAFESEGFSVVRGPDKLWGGDIKNFHVPPYRFDGVVGGSPCKAHSSLRHLINHNGYKLAENLIPEFERVVFEAQPDWFLHENVKDAPEPHIEGYNTHSFVLNNRWLGEVQNRIRKFAFGTKTGVVDLRQWIQLTALESPDYHYAVTSKGRAMPVKLLKNKKPKTRRGDLNYGRLLTIGEMARLQGLPEDFLSDAPFTVEKKREVIANGVPLPMGKALAKAIKKYLG